MKQVPLRLPLPIVVLVLTQASFLNWTTLKIEKDFGLAAQVAPMTSVRIKTLCLRPMMRPNWIVDIRKLGKTKLAQKFWGDNHRADVVGKGTQRTLTQKNKVKREHHQQQRQKRLEKQDNHHGQVRWTTPMTHYSWLRKFLEWSWWRKW